MPGTDVEGASSSINKTIAELESFLVSSRFPPTKSQRRAELHAQLCEVLTVISKRWYRKGFKRGTKSPTARNWFIRAPYLVGQRVRVSLR